jgi:thiamine-monophosphate kinase
MNEFDLIARLTRDLPTHAAVTVGPGDDCAVLHLGGDHDLLFKTDAVVEGVHFTPETEAARVGRKALARCLSDIAAMGGKPVSALVTLAMPKAYDVARIDGIYAGMTALAKAHGVAISGGETTTHPGGLLLSIALVGTVPKGRAVLRSGAKVGDAIFVTGELGGSLEGKHLDFEPRLAEGAWLAEQGTVHAMMDLSDGLAGDLRHILNASGVGAELMSRTIPVSRAAKVVARADASAVPPLLAALTDGEDFELVFTVAGANAVKVMDGFRAEFPEVLLTCIGKTMPEPGLRLRDQRGVWELGAGGYEHFGRK